MAWSLADVVAGTPMASGRCTGRSWRPARGVLDRWAIEQNDHDLKEVEGIGAV